ncbi:MAG: DUF1624 domain-containing protein [Deltaproteobacteria bacterium]|nr:DUF1624 domain-containing protein [Deltaproteobacteria bacterium]
MSSEQNPSSEPERAHPERAPRNPVIDEFRGLAILMMVPVNYLEHVRAVPASLKHAKDVGLTVADLVAPFFIFAVALTSTTSLRRRFARDGGFGTFEHLLRRSMALIGIGALFSIGETSHGFNVTGGQWGTLQAIGVSVLLSAPMLAVSPKVRLVLALVGLSVYQWALDAYWLESVLAANHAGIKGSLSWALLLVLGTVVADLGREGGRHRASLWALGLLSLGLAASLLIPVSKHRMSLSFDLIVCGLSGLLFVLLERLGERGWSSVLLVRWGRNPLLLYVSHLVTLGIFLVPEAPWWHVEAPLGQAIVQGGLYLFGLDLWARFLERRRFFLSL